MKILNSTQVTDGITYSAGYTHGCSVMIVHAKPNSIPEKEKLHYHTQDSEYFYVLNGSMIININGKDVQIRKGQCLEAEPNEAHKIVGISEGVEYIVVRTNILPAEKVVLEM